MEFNSVVDSRGNFDKKSTQNLKGANKICRDFLTDTLAGNTKNKDVRYRKIEKFLGPTYAHMDTDTLGVHAWLSMCYSKLNLKKTLERNIKLRNLEIDSKDIHMLVFITQLVAIGHDHIEEGIITEKELITRFQNKGIARYYTISVNQEEHRVDLYDLCIQANENIHMTRSEYLQETVSIDAYNALKIRAYGEAKQGDTRLLKDFHSKLSPEFLKHHFIHKTVGEDQNIVTFLVYSSIQPGSDSANKNVDEIAQSIIPKYLKNSSVNKITCLDPLHRKPYFRKFISNETKASSKVFGILIEH